MTENIGSKHDRQTMLLTYTRITSARDFGEFLGTFRYAATEFYLMIILVI